MIEQQTIFRTNVPGAPFQLFARRGPSGKFIVTQITQPRVFEFECPPGMELLVGTDADRLIAAVTRERPEDVQALKDLHSGFVHLGAPLIVSTVKQ